MHDFDNDVFEVLEEVVPDFEDHVGAFEHILVPGSQSSLSGQTDEVDEIVDELKERDWENDGDHAKFIAYIKTRLDNIPRHSGQTTVGCERAIAYLKRLDRELSRAIQSDDDNVIDEEEAERIRDTILDFVAKLEDAYDKLSARKSERFKKKAEVRVGNTVVARINDGVDIKYYLSVDAGEGEEFLPVKLAEPTDAQVQMFALGEREDMVKSASSKIVLFEDPFLHSITRMLINSHVSAGKDIEEIYDRLKKKYNFTPREELSIQELLMEKGFPMQKDLGRIGEDADPTDQKGVEYNAVYPA